MVQAGHGSVLCVIYSAAPTPSQGAPPQRQGRQRQGLPSRALPRALKGAFRWAGGSGAFLCDAIRIMAASLPHCCPGAPRALWSLKGLGRGRWWTAGGVGGHLPASPAMPFTTSDAFFLVAAARARLRSERRSCRVGAPVLYVGRPLSRAAGIFTCAVASAGLIAFAVFGVARCGRRGARGGPVSPRSLRSHLAGRPRMEDNKRRLVLP